MTTRFMRGTPYEELEVEMQMVPGFRARQSAVMISRAEERDRKNCVSCGVETDCGTKNEQRCEQISDEFAHNTNLFANKYIKFANNDAEFTKLMRLFVKSAPVLPIERRVSCLLAKPLPPFFREGHRARFEGIWEGSHAVDADAMCAALYLLSADRFLWGRSLPCIGTEVIRFEKIRIQGVSLPAYIFFHTSKSLYQGTKYISLSEFTDPELVDDETFWIVLTAFLIRRYGASALGIERSCE